MSEEERRRGRPPKSKATTDVDIVEVIGRVKRRESEEDPLLQLMDDEIKMLSKQAKQTALRQFILDKQRQIMELEKVVNRARQQSDKPYYEPIDSPLSDVNMKVLIELSKLPEDERRKVIETYAMLKAAERSASESIIPFIIGLARNNPSASSDQLAAMAKTMADAVKTGVDIAKSGREGKGEGSDLLKYFIDVFREAMNAYREADKERYERLMEEVKEAKNQQGLFDAIFLNDQIYNKLKELGFFRPPTEAKIDPRIQFEIEKLRMEHERELKKMEMDFQLRLEELRQEQQKTMAMMYGLRQIGAAAADVLLGEGTSEFTEAPQPTPQPTTSVVSTKCPKCGATISFPENAETVTCASCNTRFKVTKKE